MTHGLINEPIRLVRKDLDLVENIVNSLNMDNDRIPIITEMLRYNVLTTKQVSELSGLAVSSITNKTRPVYKGGELMTELDFTFPFRTLTESGPKFIIVNEKLYILLNSDEGALKKKALSDKQRLVRKIYSAQKASSKRRGHPIPTYNVIELEEWLFEQEEFHQLYDAWVSSNYDTSRIPSIDRKKSEKPYTIDNIQVVSWNENFANHHIERKDI
jgi:hypothetical protein